MSNVINLPGCDQKADDRFNLLHTQHPDINEFAASLGTPDEWLGTALLHVKCEMPCGHSGGQVTVSAAAVSLIVMKLEELMFDGPKVVLPIDRN